MDDQQGAKLFQALIEQDVALGIQREVSQWLAKVHLYELKGEEALHPQIRNLLKNLRTYVQSTGHTLEVTSTMRSVLQQDELFAQGRTAPGNKVTNAMGLQSYHNYGLAFDFTIDGKPVDQIAPDLFASIRHVIESMGMVSGADFGDMDHVEYHPGFDWHRLEQFFKPLEDYK